MNYRSLYLSLLFIAVISIGSITGQEVLEEDRPVYITVTTLYGTEDFDIDAWREVEEEYFNKVTSKIDLILSHQVLMSYFSPVYSEFKVINVINSWEDIMLINEMRMTLIEEAWPDEEERKAFFEKQNSFYKSKHSDEIYLTSDYSKQLEREPGQNRPYTFMIKTNILSDTEDEDSYANYKTYVENVVKKNRKILAYYPFSHFWGADSREFIEIFVADSFSEVEMAQYENNALLSKIVPDEAERKQFLSSLYSAIDSQKSSFYKNVPSLSK